MASMSLEKRIKSKEKRINELEEQQKKLIRLTRCYLRAI